jgi:hypothetical protein
MLAGAAGYTYGCNDIWQMYTVDKAPIINARTDWQVALHLPGSAQMSYLKQLFELLPWQKMELRQDLIVNKNPMNESPILCAIGLKKEFMLAYTPIGNPVKVDLSNINSQKVNAFWFNPRSGKMMRIGHFDSGTTQEFNPWSSGWGSDFLLILTAENFGVDFAAIPVTRYQ